MKFLTVDQLSELIQIPAYTIRQYVREGKISAYKVGKKYLFKEEVILKELEKYSTKNIVKV